MSKAKLFEVHKTGYDATRPYAVMATFRSFNRVVGRYETEEAANRRARNLNRRESAISGEQIHVTQS